MKHVYLSCCKRDRFGRPKEGHGLIGNFILLVLGPSLDVI